MSGDKNKTVRIYPIILLIIGIAGLIFSSISIFVNYKKAADVSGLLKPLIFNFFPFAVSFMLFKFGLKGLMKNNDEK